MKIIEAPTKTFIKETKEAIIEYNKKKITIYKNYEFDGFTENEDSGIIEEDKINLTVEEIEDIEDSIRDMNWEE